MRATLVIALACAALVASPPGARAGAAAPAPRVREWQTGALAPDKLQHASLSLTLGIGGGLATRRPVAAAGGVLALGVLKELRDARVGHGFDRGDLAADLLGAALAAVLVRQLDRAP